MAWSSVAHARSSLQQAGTPQTPAVPATQTAPAPQAPDTSSGSTSSGSSVLADRIQSLVDGALAKAADGDSLKKAGRIEIDRAALVEIRAEAAQLKTALATSCK